MAEGVTIRDYRPITIRKPDRSFNLKLARDIDLELVQLINGEVIQAIIEINTSSCLRFRLLRICLLLSCNSCGNMPFSLIKNYLMFFLESQIFLIINVIKNFLVILGVIKYLL